MKRLIRKLAPAPILSAYHLGVVCVAACWYGFPSRSMVVIGVTGTKGKSSVVWMLAKMLEYAGMRVAASSSILFKIREQEWANPHHQTMAGRFRLQAFLHQAKKAGCTHAIVEVTSEGISQHRHRFIDFDVAVFTNLSPEHIEAHGGFENYKHAKGKLFQLLAHARGKAATGRAVEKISVVNRDDTYADYFLRFAADKKYSFSARGACPHKPEKHETCFPAEHVRADASGMSFTLGGVPFSSPLVGKFNAYNAVCAAVTAHALGVDFSVSRDAYAQIKEIPGRMQFVRAGQKFTAIVDFAHTPSSFEEVFRAAQGLKRTRGRIISVFGSAGGGRDKWKRPELGMIAARHSDAIILTNDDPYDENPDEIFSSIAKGISSAEFKGSLDIIADRTNAIRAAVRMARPDDVVLFLGKGTEHSIMIGNEGLPWNEKNVVAEAIKDIAL